MTQERLKPREGLIVPNPATGKALAAAGERVTLSPYWRRRLAAGEVERVESAPSKPAKPKAREEA